MNNNYVVIMAGGIGSRFWPGSRTQRPKQFLDILGVGKSLIQLTFDRFNKICPAENIFVVTNAQYQQQVLEHLPALQPHQVLCEPSRNNTAPCIAYAAFKLQQLNPEANFVVTPSDHVILKEELFVKKINASLEFVAQKDAILTLGIQPTNPNTGYGYIHFDTEGEDPFHKVQQFTEKPNLENAKKFVASGEYLWNAGIFIWNASTLLKSFQLHAPSIYYLFSKGRDLFNTNKEQEFIDQHYPQSPNISIDYAIMEKADNIYTLPADIGWSDLGTWGSLHIESSKDEQQNVINSPNPDLVMPLDTKNCMIRTPKDKLIILKDLDDYIIVDEGDVLMIYPKTKEQEIKGITKEITKKFGDRFS
ncbi:MAG: mannose-1-phosphate guanylyltransferase [Aureispira sp.]|nr:mannose-1-phosphate guanylyltransferase [Aureispira sp.]